MEKEKNIIDAAGAAFEEPAEEQPEPQTETLTITIPLNVYLEMLAAQKALAILQAHEPSENALDTVKTRLEISEILRASKRDKEDWHDAKRFKSRIKQIHKRLLMPDATRGFG